MVAGVANNVSSIHCLAASVPIMVSKGAACNGQNTGYDVVSGKSDATVDSSDNDVDKSNSDAFRSLMMYPFVPVITNVNNTTRIGAARIGLFNKRNT